MKRPDDPKFQSIMDKSKEKATQLVEQLDAKTLRCMVVLSTHEDPSRPNELRCEGTVSGIQEDQLMLIDHVVGKLPDHLQLDLMTRISRRCLPSLNDGIADLLKAGILDGTILKKEKP